MPLYPDTHWEPHNATSAGSLGTAEGDGQPVVLLPGLGSGRRLFGTLPRKLARSGFRALGFDPVGVAPSSPHPDGAAYDFEEAARDVIAVLDDANIERASLVGTSLGGKLALQVAGLVPERIDAMVLLASAAIHTARGALVYRFFEIIAARLAADEIGEVVAPFLIGKSFHERNAALVADIARGMQPDASLRALMVAQARALADFDGASLARAVRCRTLVAAGLEDTLTDARDVAETARLIPGARVRRVRARRALPAPRGPDGLRAGRSVLAERAQLNRPS